MKDLLSFILNNIVGEKNFEIQEEDLGDESKFKVIIPKENIGFVIGKGGQTIQSIQNILRIKGKLEGKRVFVKVEEKAE